MTDAGIVLASSETIQTQGGQCNVLIRERRYSPNGNLRVAIGFTPSDAVGCTPPLRARCLPPLCSHFAISLQSMAASSLAAQRAYAACLHPSGGLSSRRAVSFLRAAALRGFRRHITSNQAFIISSTATPAPRSYRLLTTGPVSNVSPVLERVNKKMKIKKRKENPAQGHLGWIHPPPLELVTEPPPIPDPPPLRMRKCVLATLSDTCCCCCYYCYVPDMKAILVLLCFSL